MTTSADPAPPPPSTLPPPSTRPSWTYRVAFAIAAVVAAVVVYFFLIGLADGSVSSFNMGLWLALLGITGGVLFGGHRLASHGHRMWAILVLSVLAVPALLYGFFILVAILAGESWN